ncbi:hypothetical protein [Streptomyces sp. NPDC060031]|uniref:hypothetical protein n=1 Tax=Streptomyces sp. NPDC060031 TaxID=3347043 RepID=UPI0036A35143
MKKTRMGIVALTAGGLLAAAGTQAFAQAPESGAVSKSAAATSENQAIPAASAFGVLAAEDPQAEGAPAGKARATPATALYASALAVRATGKAGVKAGL